MDNIIETYCNFQEQTQNKDFDLKYMGLGLGGEVGEILNEIKKMERDDSNVLTPKRRTKIITEMGDTMWYFIGLCRQLNCSLEDIFKNNIEKLEKRKAILLV